MRELALPKAVLDVGLAHVEPVVIGELQAAQTFDASHLQRKRSPKHLIVLSTFQN